ncbi:helix-turn-helix domain-containing protein [Alicyclobacillus fastidiosus]|uniref:XRE family transcriptional regulator n=1 Tax=Alicyclobacillus fastidiosus TaxID=392011 RepID=A0ABV5A8S7_9BACL|nr:XRE family transcriptional regulator [Alicyclobacillus fastidiosus]WEH10650.1 XRE family transcriptional regulator [Alicyclobacillus fastidiosus]
MDSKELTKNIGTALRNLRKGRQLTLDQLAEMTEVSKPMLGQIERGETNPTVVTLWKIANGLNVPFSIFLDSPKRHVTVMKGKDHPRISDENGDYTIRNILSIRQPHPTDAFHVRLLANSKHASHAHGSFVTEGIWITKGQLHLELDDQIYLLENGDSIHFVADMNHTYHNKIEQDCEFIVVLTYISSEQIDY